jgi:ubiquinone/menaquinone biosynthesis C-methylase UbiE
LEFPITDGIPDFFLSDSKAEAIDEPNKTWLDPGIVAARDTKYRLCARKLKGMAFCIREIGIRTGIGSRVLEVGMGTGHFTRWLSEASGDGTEIYAFDFSWSIIQAARVNTHGLPKVKLFRANARSDLPFKDESFDIVFVRLAPLGAFGIPNVEAGYRLLKPGGWYYEAGWERTRHETPPTEWAIQHGFESAQEHRWQYWRTQSEEERNATQAELEHLATRGSQSAAEALQRSNEIRTGFGDAGSLRVMTREYLLIARKPYIKSESLSGKLD